MSDSFNICVISEFGSFIALSWQCGFFLAFCMLCMFCWELDTLCRTWEMEINSFYVWKWECLSIFARPLVWAIDHSYQDLSWIWGLLLVWLFSVHHTLQIPLVILWVWSWGWLARGLFLLSVSVSALGLPFALCLRVVWLHALSTFPAVFCCYLLIDAC